MFEEQTLKRLKEIYEQKIVTRQELTDEEISFMNDNFEPMRNAGFIDDVLYSNFIIGSLSNPSLEFDSNDTAEALRRLKELDVWKQVIGNGEYTKYEILLNTALTDPNMKLNNNDRARLVSELEDVKFTNLCLQNQRISGGCKYAILRSIEEQKYASRNEYFQILHGLSQIEKSGIEAIDLFHKIRHAQKYRADEVENEHDDAYDTLLYLTAHDMQGINKFQKKDLINALTNFVSIRSIVETEYEQFELSNEERIALIVRAENAEYIEQILKGDLDIDLGEHGLRQLVWQNGLTQGNNKNYYLQYAKGNVYPFSLSDRMKFVVWSGDKEAAKEFLENNELNPVQQVELLGSIGDRTYSEQFMEGQPESIRMYLRDQYLNEFGNEEEKQEWNRRMITISDISKLSAEELAMLPENTMVRIQRDENSGYLRIIYQKQIWRIT